MAMPAAATARAPTRRTRPRRLIAAATEILGVELVYGRVDLLRSEDRLLVSEVELTEPGLYLDIVPENAARFADALVAHL